MTSIPQIFILIWDHTLLQVCFFLAVPCGINVALVLVQKWSQLVYIPSISADGLSAQQWEDWFPH